MLSLRPKIENLITEKHAYVAQRKSIEYGESIILDRSLLDKNHIFYTKTGLRFVGFDYRKQNSKLNNDQVLLFETLEKAKSFLKINDDLYKQ